MTVETKANINREEYKGFFKLFLQQSNLAPLVCLLAFALLSAVLPAEAVFIINGKVYNTSSDSQIRSIGKSSAILASDTPGNFSLSYRRTGSVASQDTQFAVIGAKDSAARKLGQIYGDTMSVIGVFRNTPTEGVDLSVNDTYIIAGDTLYDTVFVSRDTGTTSDTVSYILSITNYSNGFDTIGLVVDTAWSNQSTGETSGTGRFSYQIFSKTGAPLTGILTYVQQETGLIGVGSNEAATAVIRVYTTGAVNADTVRLAIRAMANNGTGRYPNSLSEVGSYRGFNGIKYGGSGNAAAYVEVTVSGPLVRLAKTDTVFSPVALSGDARDTQRYVPGSMVVFTLWFDNDGTDAADTLAIEDWLDTRYVRFDSAGLTILKNISGQAAAAGKFVDSNYGNIFADSAMPTGGTGCKVALEYVAATGAWTTLDKSTSLESVSRIRWIITRSGGTLGATNGDDAGTIDAEPIQAGASTDADMGYVRYSVVIR